MAIAANAIALITKYSDKGWDKVYKAESMSSQLDSAPGMIQFTGAKTCKVARLEFGGTHAYNRNNVGDARVAHDQPYGYQTSGAGLIWEEFTLTQDIAALYPIEYFDNEESGDIIMGAATTEISRTILAPEVDAYCFSAIAKNAGKKLSAAGAGQYLAKINEAFLHLDENEVPAEKQIIFMSPRYLNALRGDSAELNRYLMQEDFKKDVSFKIVSYEGRKIVVVPPQRFHENFVKFSEGYGWDDGKYIDFIVMAKDAAVHVVKYNKVKVLSGEAALAITHMDGYAILVRMYHDLFVMENKKVAIVVCTGTFDASGAPEYEISVSGGTVEVTKPAGVKVTVVNSNEDIDVGEDFTVEQLKAATVVNVGDEVEGGTYYVLQGLTVMAKDAKE